MNDPATEFVPRAKNAWRFGPEELEYVREVLESGLGGSLEGTMNQRLERAFAQRFGAQYGITHNSGTSTMHSCLFAAGVGVGDEVIVPALTVISTAAVVVHQNAVPVFADIDPATFTMDPADVARKITPRTKAIIPVHLYGLPCDMDPLMKLADEHGLAVIEDSAQCFLGEYKGRLAGTLGHMASFSFENTKHMSTGDGGIVITDDEGLAERVRKFSCQGYACLSAASGAVRGPDAKTRPAFQDPAYKRHEFVGWNYRLPEVAAALGMAQLERLDDYAARRQQISAIYEAAIAGCPYLTAQATPPDRVNACWTFAMRYDGAEQIGVSWHDFAEKYSNLSGDGIYAAWQVVYKEPAFRHEFYPNGEALYGDLRYEDGLCPVAESLQPRLMQLKNNLGTLEEAQELAEALRRTIEHFGDKEAGAGMCRTSSWERLS